MKTFNKALIRVLLVSIMICCFATNVFSSSLYWIGGSGNWSDASHWSLTSNGTTCGCIPTINDDVFFDANSFPSINPIVTINTTAYCKNMNWTGATNTPYLASSSSNSPLYIYGSLTFVSGMNIATFKGDVYFESANGGQTITSAGKQFVNSNNIYFDGIGTYVLQDAFYTTGTIYLDKGQLNFNDKNVTANIFNSNNSNVRSLIMGNSAVTITGYYSAWYCSSTNFSVSAGSSVITFTNAGSVSFQGGSQTYNNLVFNTTSSDGSIYGNNNVFNKVYFGSDGYIGGTGNAFSKITFASTGEIGNSTADSIIFTPGKTYTLSSNTTLTINKYLQANGDCGAWIDIKSGSPGSQATISSAATSGITVNYVRMWDIKAAGGAAFIANNAVDNGDNTGWTMNTIAPKSLYWIGNIGNWNAPAHWSLTSGGTSSGCIPTIYDNVFFDANSFTTFGAQVTIDVTAYCKNMNWTGATNTPYLASSSSNSPLYIYGSLTFVSGMNIATFKGDVYFESANGGQTITSAGKQFVNSNNIYFDGIGTYVLQDAFYTTGTIYLDKGQLNFNDKNVTANIFNSNNSNVRSLIMGNSAVTITGYYSAWYCSSTNFSVSAGSSVITFTNAGSVSFQGGSQTYNNLVFNTTSSDGSIYGNNNVFNKVYFGSDGYIGGTGNAFSKITFASTGEIGNSTADSIIFTPGKTYTLSSNTTLTINKYLQAVGTSASNITIQSSSSGSQAIIHKSTGNICGEYLRLKDINAGGGANFFAGNSVNLGNNTGWVWSSCSNTGIDETLLNNSIKVYPNPITNELVIENNGYKDRLNFDILNSIGQIVFKGILLDKTIVQTAGFTSGIYLIKLENGTSSEIKKIIKQ